MAIHLFSKSSFCICLLAMVTGCATTAHMEGIYSPRLPASITTIKAAKADLASILEKREKPMRIVYQGVLHFNIVGNQQAISNFYRDYPQTENMTYTDTTCLIDTFGVRVLDDRIDIPFQPLFYRDLPGLNISAELGEVYISDEIKLRFGRDFMEDAMRVADDLFFIQQNIGTPPNEKKALFQEKAANYRAMQIKPKMPEEQRKFIVQAESLRENKEYPKAIVYFQKAIEVDQVSYPPAYFNLALLSAQIKHYNAAISYMKQYLELVPDAKDARAAQDKIYQWEMLMQK